jgi:hypothetical protein
MEIAMEKISPYLRPMMFIVMLIVRNQRFGIYVFFHSHIVTSNELVLLTIKCKWIQAILQMPKFAFFNLPHPK